MTDFIRIDRSTKRVEWSFNADEAIEFGQFLRSYFPSDVVGRDGQRLIDAAHRLKGDL